MKIIILFILVLIVILIICLTMITKNQNSNNLSLNNGNTAKITIPKNEVQNNSNNILQDDEEESLIHIESIILKQLSNNSWDRIRANLSAEYEKDENGTYFYNGYTLYCNSTYVNNIVFNTDYINPIIGGIKVGTPIEEVVKNLGKPLFRNDDLGMIGYKTTDIYAFFYKDEVSIYPNKNINNIEFENLLFKYFNKEYSGNRTNFIVEINKNYPDFTAELEDNIIILYSLNRQIEMKLYENKDIEITVYNGYKFGPHIENYIDSIKVEEKDLIEEKEIERKEAYK